MLEEFTDKSASLEPSGAGGSTEGKVAEGV